MLHLPDIRVFLEVAASGSFSEAARRLKMPKSSVTRQMDRLEGDVGQTLFHRQTRSITLTEDGRTFLPHARRLFDDAMEAEHAVRGPDRGAVGQLSVSATPTFARPFLVPHLPAFQARYPNVRINLWLTPARIEVGTEPGQVDVAIRLRSSAGPDLANRKLGEIGFWLVAAPGYLEANGTPMQPDDLKHHRIVELGPPNKAHQIDLLRDKQAATVRYEPRLQIDEPEAVCIAAAAGAGIALLPTFIVAEAVGRGALVRVLPDWAPGPIPINILYRTDVTPRACVRAFVDFLIETIGQSQPWHI